MYHTMQNIAISQLQPISVLPRNYSNFADKVQNGEEIIFLKRSTPYVVLVDFTRWQMLSELEKKSDEMKALASLQSSELEYAAGKAKELTALSDLA